MDQQAHRLREEIVARLTRLRRFAFALTGAAHAADDLMQSTVERLLAKGVPEDADLTKWMFRVCKNIWIDEIRARRVRGPQTDPDVLDRIASVDGERAAMGRIALQEVNAAMEKLPDEQRMVLALVALEGRSYKETAEILETPVGTVMSRLARARRAVAEMLSEASAGVKAMGN